LYAEPDETSPRSLLKSVSLRSISASWKKIVDVFERS
jgi:hypothetical protein